MLLEMGLICFCFEDQDLVNYGIIRVVILDVTDDR